MNIEANRLLTFEEWPSDAEVNPQRIAKAGFFCTKQGLEVECFSCHVKISEWNYGDQVMAKHISLSPTCPFVVNPSTSGNVPILSPTNIPSCSSSSDLYRQSVEIRLSSFENWPSSNIVSPESLAMAGFYYLNEGDHTKCAFCKGVVRAWEPGDNPDTEHKRHFPNCRYVIEIINPRIGSQPNNLNVSIEKDNFPNVSLVNSEQNLDELGVQAHRGPKRINFSTLESRLRSFSGWSEDLIQKPEILSEAGFYYEGMGDQVRCFHCDGGLRHWDPDDDPWTEHARWFPGCAFIKLVKGQEFVTACSLVQGTERNVRPIVKRITKRRNAVCEREIHDLLSSPPALAALNIGLNLESVTRAIREKVEQTGMSYSQPDALVEAALNIQHESEHEETGCNDVDTGVSDILREVVSSVLTDCPITEATVDKTLSEEENRLLCKICMDAEVGIVFLPCGHLVTCVNCAPSLEDCPVCRSTIKASVRTFLS